MKKVKEELFWRLGKEAYEEGRQAEALDYFNKVLELNPHRAEEISGQFNAKGTEGGCPSHHQ